jgi:hypothetical protein
MPSPSRINILCLALIFFSINLLVLKSFPRSIFIQVIIKSRSVWKTFPRPPSPPGMSYTSIWLCHLDSLMLLHILCTWWTLYSCWSWTSLSWYLLMTSWYTSRMEKSMSNAFRLFYNDFVTINFMSSSVSVHSGWRMSHFLDMSSLLKVLQLT